MSSNLLQDAVKRAALQREQSSGATSPEGRAFSTSELRASLLTSDDEDTVTTVHTPSQTPGASRSASRSGSRSTSPTREGKGGGRVGAKARREAAAREKASSLDPLRRLPNELSVRIFELVGLGADGMGGEGGDFSGVRDLLKCGAVCQKWRRSATINYIWYRLSNLSTFETSDNFQPPVWTRRDAKRDWAAHYRSINRRDNLEVQDAEEAAALASGTMTPKEEREARWREEAEQADEGPSKLEARAMYKELGGRKARTKGKVVKQPGRDRTGWEDADAFE